MSVWRPWPYAAKAIVQHNWITPLLYMLVCFRYPMEQTVKPAHNLWDCRADGVAKAIVFSVWQDDFTLLLAAGNVLAQPEQVTLAYLGPDSTLRTTWDKQWEPWAAILSYRGTGTPFSGTRTFAVEGPTDNVDVENIGVLFIDCSANDVTIGGFIGGILGQHLSIARLCASLNDITLEHNEGTGNQDILLHRGLDETLTGEYGGWELVCNGVNWFDTSHSKHV